MNVDVAGLFDDLVRLETELWTRVEARVQHAHGVPLAWVEIMQVVGATADCRVLDIARALSITVGGASKVVDKVEAAGLCRREPNPTDGRSNLIRLTEPGEGLLEATNATFAGALAAYVGSALPADELAQLSATLRRLRHHLTLPDPAEIAVRGWYRPRRGGEDGGLLGTGSSGWSVPIAGRSAHSEDRRLAPTPAAKAPSSDQVSTNERDPP